MRQAVVMTAVILVRVTHVLAVSKTVKRLVVFQVLTAGTAGNMSQSCQSTGIWLDDMSDSGTTLTLDSVL